jgi:hypothetical protein
LLDIPRGILRAQFGSTHISSACEFIDRSGQSFGDVWLLTSEQVSTEYDRHREDIFSELQVTASKFHNAASALAPGVDKSTFNAELNHTVFALRDLMDRAWRECLCVSHDPNIVAAANTRRALGLAPGRIAKANIGDCLVWESFLEICRLLRGNNFTQRLIFVTFNKDDFGTPASPKGNLAGEFVAFSIDFVTNLGSASALLGPRT